MTYKGLPMMMMNVPVRKKIRTEECLGGGDASFRAKLKHTVSRGRRGTVKRKRPASGLLALAHMNSTP